MKKNSAILVTGAGGLVGSAVVEYLRSQQYTCVMPITRKDCDLRDTDKVHELFDRCKPDYVVHAAAVVYGLGGNMANQAKSIYDNTLINTNVIAAAWRVGVNRFVAMGTNAMYPHTARVPYQEHELFHGRPHCMEAGYGHAKRHMLATLEAFNENHELPYVCLISGNIYGPRDKFDPKTSHVIPSLIAKFWQALDKGGNVEIWGDGSPKRDFIHSHDMARIIEVALSAEFCYTTLNTGSGEIRSIRQVADMLCQISGVSPDRVIFNAEKPNGRMNCASNLSRLNDMGWRREYSLVRGLKETWDWYVKGHSVR